jgi:hypothetical protein
MSRGHAVIDLANAVPLRSTLTRLASDAGISLFDPDRFSDLVPVGPWLVDLAARPDVGDALRTQGLRRAWGYVLHGSRDLAGLRHHLRKFNRVQIAGRNDQVLFRYFDPVVLHRCLTEIFDIRQIASFCEGIDAIEIEAGRTGSIEVLRPETLMQQAAGMPATA